MPRKLKFEADGWLAASAADLRGAQKQTWFFIGRQWHKLYKANKFTRAGARKYGFTPRKGDPGSGRPFKGSYQEAKLLRVPMFSKAAGDRFDSKGPLPIGEVKPNVWSGQSRTSAMASNKVRATAKSGGKGKADVIIDAPTLHRHLPSSRVRPHLEVVRITRQELKHLSELGADYFSKTLVKLRRKRTLAKL